MIKFFAKGFSHGDGYFCKAIGLPAGFVINKNAIDEQLARRRNTVGRSERMNLEKDEIVFLSGIDSNGKTDGSPLQFFIKNSDNTLSQKPSITAMRSGHADLAGCTKLGLNDARIVCELSSARRTVAYTALGAICKQILAQYGVYTYFYVKQIGTVACTENFDYFKDNATLNSALPCPDAQQAMQMKEQITKAREQGDSIGGKVVVGCVGLPMGMGDFVNYHKKLDGIFAKSMMSIPSVKAVEFGLGTDYAKNTHTSVADTLNVRDEAIIYSTNNCGGVVAGLTTNQPVSMTLTVKPVPTTKKGFSTVDIKTKQQTISHFERSDTCIVPAVGVVAENVLATIVLEKLLEYKNDAVIYKKFNKTDFSCNTVFVVDKQVLAKTNLIENEENVFVVQNAETDKSLETASKLLLFLAQLNLSKNDTLVAIGGGSISDLAGFVASIYKRGIRFCVVPTTLLAMVDAGVGGKNAINFNGAKNLIGTVYLPEKTIIDFEFLNTNTQQNQLEGFGEIVKYALINSNIFNALTLNYDLKTLVKLCVDFKTSIVAMDEKDDFWRRQLNMGHTFGHAFEVYFNMPHGEAILMGLIWETMFAKYLGVCNNDFASKTINFLNNYINKAQKKQLKKRDVKSLIQLCMADKKNEKQKVGFVFVAPYNDFCLKTVSIEQIEEFFDYAIAD